MLLRRECGGWRPLLQGRSPGRKLPERTSRPWPAYSGRMQTVVAPRLGWLLLLVVSLSACREKASSGPPAAEATAESGPRLYVLGSSIHLRKAPSPEGESLEKLPIGTECVLLDPTPGEWRKVRCGGKEGYASATLLGSEKPSLEKLKAEARDPKLPLAQREDSALRAATLAPKDFDFSQELAKLFFERNFELLAGLKKPLKGPEFEVRCESEEAADCIRVSMGFVRGVRRRIVTKGKKFVAVIGNSEQVAVYRGRFQLDKLNHVVIEEVLERTLFTPTPVLEQALFSGAGVSKAEDSASSPRLGEFVLEAPAQNLMKEGCQDWTLVNRSEEGALTTRVNGCTQRPYKIRFVPDIHGRWLAMVDRPGAPFAEDRWVSTAVKTKQGVQLTLARTADDATPQVFDIAEEPEGEASLGDALYVCGSGDAEQPEPCGSVEAPVGVSFSGEFLPAKAMTALFGNFDAAAGASRWAPLGEERQRLLWFQDFAAPPFTTKPWKWAPYTEGEQEKMLFLTETAPDLVSHGSGALIGGGIFSKTQDGWRLERANRVITPLGSFGAAPGFDISVQGVGERGFIAFLTTGYTGMGTNSTALELLSNVDVAEAVDTVGTIEDLSDGNQGFCASGEGEEGPSCVSYDSTWQLVPNPERRLPDLVVTTKGTRMGEGKDSEVESVHKRRTFSFSGGTYSLSSEQNLRP